MQKIIAAIYCFALFFPACAMAASVDNPILPTQIHLTASASYRVVDTELHATLAAQASGNNPAALASRMNQTVSWADTHVLSSVHGVRWFTGGYATIRTGDKSAPWRVQESIVVESTDPSALLPLLGTLQSRLQLQSLHYVAAQKDLGRAKNHAGIIALHRFMTAAKRDCSALGFSDVPHLGRINMQAKLLPMPFYPSPVMMATVREAPGPVTSNAGVTRGAITASGSAYCR
jgi:predicted secreted protein